ncbi:hypothetical protein J6590_001958 [Homalodisca vitripennis]|nr:hypothetical protein J6590_001958 [Homalodisca vitripennis]
MKQAAVDLWGAGGPGHSLGSPRNRSGICPTQSAQYRPQSQGIRPHSVVYREIDISDYLLRGRLIRLSAGVIDTSDCLQRGWHIRLSTGRLPYTIVCREALLPYSKTTLATLADRLRVNQTPQYAPIQQPVLTLQEYNAISFQFGRKRAVLSC